MSDRWRRVGALFEAALSRPAGAREAWIAASPEPADIQREVLSLLAANDQAGSFLEEPAAVAETAPTGAPAAAQEPVADTTLSPGAAPLAAGVRIGFYLIIRVIGQGGMGIVYEAEDTRLGRRVALKAVSPALGRDEQLRKRLRREARAAAAIAHPNVATIYALEEVDDQLFIAAELVEGHTLRLEIEQGPLPIERALTTARDIARGLLAAHARGVVHRDLKPENVLRAGEDGVKILDFGIAQLEPGPRHPGGQTRLTETGLLAGTPPYMAPEQLLGQKTDARVDQFAFGVLLYELLCGRHPFGGTSLPSVIARVLASAPERPARADIPDTIWMVIERCLRKNPGERFETTTDLLRALDSLVSNRGAEPGEGETATDAEKSTTANGALWWWQFHQIAGAVAYWLMVWPAWHVHRWLGHFGLPFFLLLLASIVVSGNLRLHLWFSSRIYPARLDSQRTQVRVWVRAADIGFVLTLVAAGLGIGDSHVGWAALLIAFAIGSAVAFLMIEPSTAAAAFDALSRNKPERRTEPRR